jgi:plastocyanin
MRRSLVLLAGAAVLIAPASTGEAATTPVAREVVLKDIAFRAAVVRITPGQRVRWRWLDGQYVAHNIRSVGRPRFPGATTRTSGTYTVRFRSAGRFRYTCTLHPGMDGTVVVARRR